VFCFLFIFFVLPGGYSSRSPPPGVLPAECGCDSNGVSEPFAGVEQARRSRASPGESASPPSLSLSSDPLGVARAQ